MVKRCLATFVGLLAAASGHAVSGPCSSVAPLSARELSQNGAVVSSGTFNGLGFVVGWRQGEAWIAVPAHVIFGPQPVFDPEEAASYRANLKVLLSGDTAPRRLCDKGPTPQ